MAKSVIVSYVLWLFGGIFGLHHFYLGRDRHCFVWCSTVGGLVFGWIRDLWRIPYYVSEANQDAGYLEKITDEMRKFSQPGSSHFRASGASFLGYFFGTLVINAIPTEPVFGYDLSWLKIFYPAGVAIGVHTVGNIGRMRGNLFWAVVGSYMATPLGFYITNPAAYCAMMAAYMFSRKSRDWRRTPEPRRNVVVRFCILSFWVTIYAAIVSSALYYNGEFVDKNGETIKVREAIANLFTSPFWLDLRASILQIYNYAQAHGWKKIWEEVVELLDPQGEKNALQTLNLNSGASQAEITTRWRKLSREWHPDKQRDPQKKEEAHIRFTEIQAAYATLSDIKNRRISRNRKDNESPPT